MAALGVTIPLSFAIFGAMIGYLVFASFRWIHMQLAGQEGQGLGDCKLMACIGAWLGPELLVMQSVMSHRRCVSIRVGDGTFRTQAGQ